ncbi:MAG: hypothetical protein RIS35_1579 [Pseudomonadota bacterium]|jgi:dTDP-4-amino-4,6-dideoxygalactose transaminase
MPRHALLVPDLPQAHALLPWLERIDAQRQYANFGPLVRELESRLADWVGTLSTRGVDVVTLSSGTAALELGLQAMHLPPGSRVLVPALTFPATALAVMRCGHQPVLTDVDPDRWTMTPEIARAHASDAVIPVATYGLPLDAPAWDAFTRETGRPVLIDAASALGWQAVGETTAVAFSLHATKPFGCGEGGLLVTAAPDLAEEVRRLSNFGFAQRQSVAPGTNAKMSEYAAAVALAQFARREELLGRRRRLWNGYRTALDAIADATGLRRQANPDDVPASVLCVRLPADHSRPGRPPGDAGVGEDFDAPGSPAARIGAALALLGIETRAWYCPPLHRHAGMAQAVRDTGLPVADALSGQLLGLPFHHFLNTPDIDEIVDSLRRTLLETY